MSESMQMTVIISLPATISQLRQGRLAVRIKSQVERSIGKILNRYTDSVGPIDLRGSITHDLLPGNVWIDIDLWESTAASSADVHKPIQVQPLSEEDLQEIVDEWVADEKPSTSRVTK